METLSTRISRDGPFDQLDAVGWIIRLAKGLEPIHALGVAHGSITGDAIKIESSSPTSRGFLVDARRLRDFPSYHSPERADGERISPENDTWAVAVILYLSLTGSLPFPGRNDEEVKEKIDGPPPSPLATFDVGDDALQRVIDRAFHRELAGRLTNLRELREALEAWHPEAKALPALEDDEDQHPLSGAHPVPSEPGPGATGERPTPVVDVDAASNFAMPMADDDEAVTAIRTYPMQQQRALAKAQPAAAAGRPRPVKLPQVTPPPPKSTRGTLLGMASPLAEAPTKVAPPPVRPAPAQDLDATRIAPPPVRRAPAEDLDATRIAPPPAKPTPAQDLDATKIAPPPASARPVATSPASAPAPALGLGGTVMLDSSPVRDVQQSAPREALKPAKPGGAPQPRDADAPTPMDVNLDMATPDPIPRSALGPVPVDSPAVIPLAEAMPRAQSVPMGSQAAPNPGALGAPDPGSSSRAAPPRQPVSLVPPAKPKRGFLTPLLVVLVLAGGGAAAAYRFRPDLFASLGLPGAPSVAVAEPPAASTPAATVPAPAASAAPTATASAAQAATASTATATTSSAAQTASPSAPASPAGVAACLFPLFAEQTFVEPPSRLNTICQITDPRKGGEVIKTEVILAGERRLLSDGMREWAILGWYEMPSFGMMQHLCCPSHPELDIPITMPPCEIEAPLKELITVATSPDSDDEKVKAAVKAYTKEAKCIGRAGASDSYGRKSGPQGGEDVAFKKTLDRVRAAVKKKK